MSHSVDIVAYAIFNHFLNSQRPSDAHTRRQTRSSLVQIMAVLLQTWKEIWFIVSALRKILHWNLTHTYVTKPQQVDTDIR